LKTPFITKLEWFAFRIFSAIIFTRVSRLASSLFQMACLVIAVALKEFRFAIFSLVGFKHRFISWCHGLVHLVICIVARPAAITIGSCCSLVIKLACSSPHMSSPFTNDEWSASINCPALFCTKVVVLVSNCKNLFASRSIAKTLKLSKCLILLRWVEILKVTVAITVLFSILVLTGF